LPRRARYLLRSLGSELACRRSFDRLKLAAKSSVTWVAVETAREMEKRRGASLFRRWFPQ
jgi:hypothetical protein